MPKIHQLMQLLLLELSAWVGGACQVFSHDALGCFLSAPDVTESTLFSLLAADARFSCSTPAVTMTTDMVITLLLLVITPCVITSSSMRELLFCLVLSYGHCCSALY